MEAEPQRSDISALSAGFTLSMAAISPRQAAYEIATRVRGFMDMPNESVQRRRNHGNYNDDNPPPLPRSHVRVRFKSASREDAGTLATRESSSGLRDRFKMENRSELSTDETKSLHSSLASGSRSWTTGSSKNSGVRREPDRGTLRLRVARRLGHCIALWK